MDMRVEHWREAAPEETALMGAALAYGTRAPEKWIRYVRRASGAEEVAPDPRTPDVATDRLAEAFRAAKWEREQRDPVVAEIAEVPPDVLRAVIESVPAADWSIPEYPRILAAQRVVRNRKEPAGDLLIVARELVGDKGNAPVIEAAQALADLVAHACLPGSVEFYAAKVREQAACRRLYAAMVRLREQAEAGSLTLPGMQDELLKLLKASGWCQPELVGREVA